MLASFWESDVSATGKSGWQGYGCLGQQEIPLVARDGWYGLTGVHATRGKPTLVA